MHAILDTRMPIHHVTYTMQEMHKGNYTYATKKALTHPTQEIKHTPSFPRKRVKVA
jgi:hypothetical protein